MYYPHNQAILLRSFSPLQDSRCQLQHRSTHVLCEGVTAQAPDWSHSSGLTLPVRNEMIGKEQVEMKPRDIYLPWTRKWVWHLTMDYRLIWLNLRTSTEENKKPLINTIKQNHQQLYSEGKLIVIKQVSWWYEKCRARKWNWRWRQEQVFECTY